MRLLRALAHLVLALALVSVTTAQARAVLCVPAAFASQQQKHADEAVSVTFDHAGHDHGGPTDPAHTHDSCPTVCCFTAGQLPAHAPPMRTVAFRAVQYAVEARIVSGRAFAPDPGVPKLLA